MWLKAYMSSYFFPGQIQLNLKLLFINLLLWAACHPQLALNSAAQTLQSAQHEEELSPTLVLQSSLLPDVFFVDKFNPTAQTHFSHVGPSLDILINTPASDFPDAASQSTTFTLSLTKEFYLESSEKTLFPVSASFIDSVADTPRWISPSLYETSGLPPFETPAKVFNIASPTDIVSSSDSILESIESSYQILTLSSSSLLRTPSPVYKVSDLTSQTSDNFSRFLSSPMSVHWTSKLLDINSTVVISSSSEHIIPSRAEETTPTDWPSSASLITSLPPGNLSCAQGGDDCEEVNEGLDDGVRLKVIIGVVCGAAALVLLLGKNFC